MDSCIILPVMIGLGMGIWSSQAIQNQRLNSVILVETFGKEACFSIGVAEKIDYKPKAAGSLCDTTWVRMKPNGGKAEAR